MSGASYAKAAQHWLKAHISALISYDYSYEYLINSMLFSLTPFHRSWRIGGRRRVGKVEAHGGLRRPCNSFRPNALSQNGDREVTIGYGIVVLILPERTRIMRDRLAG